MDVAKNVHVVTVGGKTYELVKRGKEQADQVIRFTQWLSQYALPIFQKFSNPDANMTSDMSYIDIFKIVLTELNAEALVSLFGVLVGCTHKIAEDEFDIGLLD